MKRCLPALGMLATLGFAAYFVYFIGQTFSLAGVAALFEGRSIIALVGAGCIYVLVIPFSGWAWSRLLAEMGLSWHWGRTAAVIGVAQIAKYVPGNVAQHVGRAALVLPRKMPADIFAASVLLETLLTMAAALLIGSFGLFLAEGGADGGGVLRQILGFSLLVLALAVPACGVLLFFLQGWRRRSSWAQRWISESLRFPRAKGVLQALLAYSLNFLALGAALLLVCDTLGASARLDYLYLTAAFAFAWLAGFMAPGLPAGLGARESVLSIFLIGYMPQTELLNVLLGMRLATVAGDVLSFVLGAALARRYLSHEGTRLG